MRFNQFVNEMDSQGYSGSRDKKSHSKYGSRDDYELGEPETTLGPDSIAKPKDVAKQGMSALSKAMKQAHSKGVAEGSGNIGNQIKALYQKIYDQGDDAIEFMYNDSPIFAQYWDEYEGDLDSIIAEIDPKELQIIFSELQSAAEDQGITEVSTEMRNRYVTRASDDYGSANFAARASKSHPGLEDYSREQEARAKKRAAGLGRALSDKRLGRETSEAYTVTRGINRERYQERPGLEGPFSTKSGKVVYYDKVEGKYYDPDTDMYIEYDDWRAMNEGGSALSQAVREAGWGRRSSYYNPMDQERREQDQMDYDKRAFKRAEMQHELGHEDDPNFERNLRQQQIDRDRGPWYLRIDGKVYRQKGQPKSFDWKRGANNYALAMIKNNPGLQGKIMLTKSAEDK